jgi:hypothetical protein
MRKQVTARQAMTASIQSTPEMKRYLKNQKAARKAAAAEQEEKVMTDLYGPKFTCVRCRLVSRTKRASDLCETCATLEALVTFVGQRALVPNLGYGTVIETRSREVKIQFDESEEAARWFPVTLNILLDQPREEDYPQIV